MHIHRDDRLREDTSRHSQTCVYTHPLTLTLLSFYLLCGFFVLCPLLSMKGPQTHMSQARMNTGRVAFDQGRIRLSAKGRTRVGEQIEVPPKQPWNISFALSDHSVLSG